MREKTEPLMLGSYRLVAELGHGGMADVFLAAVEGPQGSGFTKLAVVKKLRPNLAEDPAFISMLMDEARITARLSHPNVVQLFEAGQGCDDEFFLAMEYLEGQPLYRIERRAKRLGVDVPRELYYAIVADLLAGLHYAHELTDYDGSSLDIVHRDVTPHNIFVTYDGVVKVVDFGIAKAMGRSTETKNGVVKGKVRYMSPEQALGGEVDRRTDIFAAGVILWNAATGTRFWGELADLAVVGELVSGTYPTSPRTVDPNVPEAIDAICRRALAVRPEDRFVTAAEMRSALEAFLAQRRTLIRRELQATMKQLFAKERESLRGVLETAGLTSTASVDTFTAGAEQQANEVLPLSSSGPEEPGQYTLVMPNAPPRLAASREVHPHRMPVDTSVPAGVPVASKGSARFTVAVGTLVVAAAIFGIVARHIRRATPANDTAEQRAPRVLEIAPNVDTLDRTTRNKAVTEEPDAGNAGPTPTGRPHRPSSDGFRRAGPAASPPSAPAPPTSTARTSSKDTKIDSSDPWKE